MRGGAALLVLITVAASAVTPSVEARRTRLGDDATWSPCTADGESRPAAPCVRPYLVAAHKGRRIPSSGRLHVTLRADTVPASGPLAITIEAFAYAALPTEPVVRTALKLLRPTLARGEEHGTLGRVLGLSTAMQAVPQNPLRGLAAVPASVTLQLPDDSAGRRVAFAIWAWPAVTQAHALPIEVAAQTTLHLAAGLRDVAFALDAPPITLSAVLADRDGQPVANLWRLTLDAAARPTASGWHEKRVDLSPWAGRRLTLRLETDGVAARAYGLWARPLVVHATADTPTSVLLLSLDTLRADHLGAYGYVRPTTPNLDRLAAESLVFTRAFAPFPSTTASHMSMLTARLPCDHRVTAPGQQLRHDVRTVGELFADAGFATAALTEDGLIKGSAGFSRGFDRYRDLHTAQGLGSFDDVIRRADAWLDGLTGEPFFLFLHTYQVHLPYKFPPRLSETFTVEAGAPRAEREKADYDRGLRYADELVGDLLTVVERARRRGPVAFVVTSDHGTEFGEHGGIGHARGVHTEQLHVPLLIHHPPLGRGERIADLAELTDLPRTMLTLAELTAPAALGGTSLVPIQPGDTRPARQVFGEQLWGPRQTSLRTKSFTWIQTPDGTRVYDGHTDPGELHDLASARPTLAARGRAAILAFRRACKPGRTRPGEPAVSIDPERIKSLRSLGYLE